jgi:hypothetical protein
MKTMRTLVVLVMLVTSGLAAANRIHMRNGSVLVAPMVWAGGEVVIFKTPSARDIVERSYLAP